MIVIVDENTGPALPANIEGETLDVRSLDHVDALSSPVVVLDIDLSDIHKVEKARRLLKKAPRLNMLACAVDLRNFHARTQAFSLGAKKLLRKPLAMDDLVHLAEQTGGRSQTAQLEARQRAEQSMRQASDALASAFESLFARSDLDVAQIAEASSKVLHSVQECGLEFWLQTVRAHHEGTYQHCLLVTGVAAAYGLQSGMTVPVMLEFTQAALLHDIGKVDVPVGILDKPSELTLKEYEIIKRHPLSGFDYLKTQHGLSNDILRAVRDHHEYLDGTGYPHGLTAEMLGGFTRALTVCDIYGALVEKRAYKDPMSSEKATNLLLEMVAKGKIEQQLVVNLARAVNVRITAKGARSGVSH